MSLITATSDNMVRRIAPPLEFVRAVQTNVLRDLKPVEGGSNLAQLLWTATMRIESRLLYYQQIQIGVRVRVAPSRGAEKKYLLRIHRLDTGFGNRNCIVDKPSGK